MEEMRVVLAGFGGQGLLFAGKVMAHAALIDNHEVSWLPSYGPEMRGGTANCSVIISDDPIGSPLVTDPTVLIAMNQPSVDKFIDEVVPGGIVLIDESLVNHVPERDDVKIFTLNATKMAEEAGLKGLANIVLVGKLFAETSFCSAETLEEAIRHVVPARKAAYVQKNIDAVKLGAQA
ncbi:2-oxoglutarate ferredoxin oxidoreductase subunit gamma [Slackia heliotrinireducens]|jgi:2-oxoglutarate ferredoxin oxidoreductase subunit gamma|uniref:2-oxoacid:ferredoxin oxidoreductase, gamma subunit n=2 Tax=Slackia TaxID=84108 RepID=C7N795_SLAHD|nr:2-oxoacid:acceptor oxidoreductase family protein [Slackia heliotrinireducens]ACV22780.1 2-oxoacid:ferredoxin oxidoreductase, gamma subunit [Slackia heliotrinireducens DSM 20476]VEH01464.1 2-oxoglutarate ferredoxin oxidoreductase subunit gamma [Slackia heliotrinireducens]